MKKLTTNSDDGYRIIDDGHYYTIVISDEKANKCVTYEYDAACGSLEDVEKELQEHTFNEMVKRYSEQCVYCECVEELY